MADDPDVRRDLIDVAMRSTGARAILHRLGGEHEARNLRTDLSAVIGDVLAEEQRAAVLREQMPHPREADTSISARPRGSHRRGPASPWRWVLPGLY